MRKHKFLTLFMLLGLFAGSLPAQSTVAPSSTIDLRLRDGDVTPSSIARQIETAKQIFRENPRQIVVIDIPIGTFDLTKGTQGKGTIDVSEIQPGPGGWLIFRGVNYRDTILKFERGATWIYGRNAHRIAFQNLQMKSDKPCVSQGHVVSVGMGKVVLDIQPGFASPGEIYSPTMTIGRWLRRYTDSQTNPQIIQDAVIPVNAQVKWETTKQISGRRWQMNLSQPQEVANYHPGDLVGIKSKQTGNTYFFYNSSDITFDHVQWKGKSRGVFRGGTSRVTISNCRIARSEPINGQAQCLSTPDGGPQLGQPNDAKTGGHRVENCEFHATGDDSIAFFNASGTISNNKIRDSFARGIVRYQSPNVELTNNELIRCQILNML